MNTATKRWVGLTLLGLVMLMASQFAGWMWVAGASKLTASTGFVMVAITRGALRSGYGKWIVAALVFSWWGDAFLIGDGAIFFQLGLVSFLLGHVGYCGAFWVRGVKWAWCFAALIAVLPVAAGVLRWLLPNVPGELRGPVLAYIAVISTMVVLAVGTRGRGGAGIIVLGALMFYFSDIAVARAQFIAPESLDYLWGLPLYYVGQICLASSVGSRGAASGIADGGASQELESEGVVRTQPRLPERSRSELGGLRNNWEIQIAF